MNRFWKCFCVCLLAMALPLQGLAAVVMVHCQGFGAEAAVVSTADEAQLHPGCEHAAEAAPPALHSHGHASVDAAATPAGDHGCAGCLSCAACCLAFALPVSSPVLANAAPATVLPQAANALQPAFLADKFERPPRRSPHP